MSFLDGKKILITGGTGSFGNAFIDFAQKYDTKFVVFSRDEKKQHDMYVERMNDNIDYVVGDIRNKERLLKYLNDVDYILHAAALKHVPTGENFPEEVIMTNILGTQNVIEAAEECGVRKIVNLSTDKAVYPINAYGMSKAMAEKLIGAHKGNTECLSLRYGNVLGSRGSVIPLFLGQINNNKPLTITNCNMTRFLLSLDNAVSLALKCLEIGRNSDLFVIKPPACSVGTLVEAFELHFQRDLEKKVIGVRPGEKMDETLLTAEEINVSSNIEQNGIIYAKISSQDKDIGDYFYKGDDFKKFEPFTSANTIQLDATKVLDKIYQAGLL